jgi:two-component system LytT family response regulator
LLQNYQEEQTSQSENTLISDKKEVEENKADRLIVKSSGKIYFIPYEEIHWIEAYDYYIKIHVKDRFFLVRETMKRMEERLPENLFARIHKSSIIHLDQIKELEPHFNGEFIVHLKNGCKLKLSRNYKQALMNRFGDF